MNFLKKNIVFTILMVLSLLAAFVFIYMDLIKHSDVTSANAKTQELQEKYDNAHPKFYTFYFPQIFTIQPNLSSALPH